MSGCEGYLQIGQLIFFSEKKTPLLFVRTFTHGSQSIQIILKYSDRQNITKRIITQTNIKMMNVIYYTQ